MSESFHHSSRVNLIILLMQKVILIQVDQEGTKAEYCGIQAVEHTVSESISKSKEVTGPQRLPAYTNKN